ncbi:MAG: hypothetical protein HY000_31685 [Planctomycetes bacterium]|nr:hypothetical protein [Planctomycetota bacterium]
MKTADPRITITRTIQSIVETNAAPGSVASSASLRSLEAVANSRRERWQQLIDDPLIEWGRDPQRLADAEITPPSRDTVRLACQLAQILGNFGEAPPNRVVPTVDGGIVFEWHHGNLFKAIEVTPEEQIEYRKFVNSRLIERGVWPIDVDQ